jgi:hypothetical protein
MQPKRLADDAANSIPLHRTAGDTNRDREPDAWAAHAGPGHLKTLLSGALLSETVHSHSEESIAETLSVRVGGVELRLTADTTFRGEPQPSRVVADQASAIATG